MATPNVSNLSQQALFQQTERCPLYNFVFYTVIIGSLCVVGIVGNIIAFYVFCKDKVKTSTSFLFQGLSVIDTVLLLECIPIYSVKFLLKYLGTTGPIYEVFEACMHVYVLPCVFIAQSATIWVTVLVGINRFIAVCKPYQAPRLCTVNQARKQLALIIFCSILYNIPNMMQGRITYDEIIVGNKSYLGNVTVMGNATTFANSTRIGYVTEMKIQVDYNEFAKSKLYKIIYRNIFYMMFLLILPMLILTFLNIRLIHALKELGRRRAEMQSLRQQQDNNITFVLIIVVLVFTICQAPALVNQILWNFLPDNSRQCGHFQFYFSPICNFLVVLNSAVNFLIYFLFNTRFRQVLVESLCKKDFRRDYTQFRVTNANAGASANHSTAKDTQESLL